jgi:tetratricopeptide (TPR) repeat protein
MEAREHIERLAEVHQHEVEHEIEDAEEEGHGEHGGSASLYVRWVGVLVAVITLLAGFAAVLQNDASVRSANYRRLAQQLSIEATGANTTGQAQVNYAIYNDRIRNELGVRAAAAQKNGDDATAQDYYALIERIAALSPAASAPYSDDISLYTSDTYLVNMTQLQEQSAVDQELYETWESRSHTYILQLTLLAVSLAMFGLATTVSGPGRPILIATGGTIVLVALVWIGAIYFKPVEQIPDTAIKAYAQGQGLSNQGKHEEAIAAYEQAVAASPEYGRAHYEIGNEQLALGKYDAAIDAYKETVNSGLDNANVEWDLGWAQYLLGHFDEATNADRQALALNNDLIPVHFNLALALLAGGHIDEATKEYTDTMGMAAGQVAAAKSGGQVVAASFFEDVDASRQDLDSLVGLLSAQTPAWAEVPPKASISDTGTIKSAAQGLSKQLANLSVALEATGKPPSGTQTAVISPFKFAAPARVSDGTPTPAAPDLTHPDQTSKPTVGLDSGAYTVADSFLTDTGTVDVFFDYSGLSNGRTVLWKVSVDGQEDDSFRRHETWSLGESGTAMKPISLVLANPGEYTVSLYVDSHLVQTGTFTLQSP